MPQKTQHAHSELAKAPVEPSSSAEEQTAQRRAVRRPSHTAQQEPAPQKLADIATGRGALQKRRRPHIPNEIRRAIVARDGVRCTYIDGEGHRYPARTFLELHHEHAHALGGPSTLENLRILCGAHNRLLAEQDFGRAHQRLFTEPGLEPARQTEWSPPKTCLIP